MVLQRESSIAFHKSHDKSRSGMGSIRLLPAATARSDFALAEENDEEAVLWLSVVSQDVENAQADAIHPGALTLRPLCSGRLRSTVFFPSSSVAMATPSPPYTPAA